MAINTFTLENLIKHAKEGSAKAQHNLGQAYAEKLFVAEKNYVLALSWYQMI